MLRWLFLFLALFSLSFKHAKVGVIDYASMVNSPLIILDPGHGGLDLGARIKHPYIEEKRICLLTAHLTKKYLEQLGYRVILTRSRDFALPLQRRVDIANKANAEIFVSIHFNSCPNPLAKGIEIFYSKEKSRQKASHKLAEKVLFSTFSRASISSRGVKDGQHLFVIRETKMPAILIEGGFLTNAEERQLLRTRKHLDLLAKGIAEGIDRFFH